MPPRGVPCQVFTVHTQCWGEPPRASCLSREGPFQLGVMEAPTVLVVGCEPLGAASRGPSPSWGAAGASPLPLLGPARRRGPQHT